MDYLIVKVEYGLRANCEEVDKKSDDSNDSIRAIHDAVPANLASCRVRATERSLVRGHWPNHRGRTQSRTVDQHAAANTRNHRHLRRRPHRRRLAKRKRPW